MPKPKARTSALALAIAHTWLLACSSGSDAGPAADSNQPATGGQSSSSAGTVASAGSSGQGAGGQAQAGSLGAASGTAGQGGTAQAGTSTAGTAGTDAAQAGTAQAGTTQAGTTQAGTTQAGAAQAGAAQGGAAQAGTDAGGAATGGTGGAPAVDDDLIQALVDWLAIARADRPPLTDQAFATSPLTAPQADQARDLLWTDHAAYVQETRQAETEAKSITLGDKTLIYDFTIFGDMPATGRSLFISLHGGGEADASVNDEQWENQKTLYQPDEGIYLAPRAPTNTWNLWHEAHIDPLFDRLITNLIVFEQVDPNRVYVMGYSAGGDGVYQLGPRMADYWAAAAMMAGHPNDAQPDSLRNIGFTIHVGGLDTAYDRNLVAEEWGGLLDDLQAQDPEGYPHYVEIHPDKPHWMDLEDAVAVPWMADFTRNPVPDRVVWLQDDVTHERFYWLAVHPEDAVQGARIVAEYAGQQVTLEAEGVHQVKVRLSDAMLDLDQPVTISAGGSNLFDGVAERTILSLWTTTEERGDPALVFPSEIEVTIP